MRNLLDEMPYLEPQTAQRLLVRYGGVDEVLAQVLGVGRRVTR